MVLDTISYCNYPRKKGRRAMVYANKAKPTMTTASEIRESPNRQSERHQGRSEDHEPQHNQVKSQILPERWNITVGRDVAGEADRRQLQSCVPCTDTFESRGSRQEHLPPTGDLTARQDPRQDLKNGL